MTKKINLGYFLLGIIFVITALIALCNPAADLVAIVLTFAIAAIIKGIVELALRSKYDEYSGKKSGALLVLGVLDLIIGLYLVVHPAIGLIALPYVFAVWFIFDSIFELAISDAFKQFGEGYYVTSIIISVLGVIIGFMLLFDPITSSLTAALLLGFYFLIYGIKFLLASFN